MERREVAFYGLGDADALHVAVSEVSAADDQPGAPGRKVQVLALRRRVEVPGDALADRVGDVVQALAIRFDLANVTQANSSRERYGKASMTA